MNVDELMTEMGWVRRLARSLVGPEAADDIAQDAYLVASEHAPEDGRPLRPWLHRVVTNLARMRHRSTTRRTTREQGIVASSVATPDQLVERVEVQRALADEVLVLREPYRSTILLHYVEGLSSADIARQLGIPSATVRQRLKHALDELRDRLQQREHAPKQGWLLALVPIAQVKPPLAVGALVMKKWLIALAVLLLLVCGSGLVWKLVVKRSTESSSTTVGGSGGVKQPAAFSTTIAGKPIDVPAWVALPNGKKRHLAGRVVANAASVPGAIVRLGINLSSPRIGAPAMTAGPPFVEVGKREADRDGNFDFGMVPPANFVVSAEAEGKAPTSLGIDAGNPRTGTDHVVIALGECRSRVVGTVRDSANTIAHARLLIAGLTGSESDAKGAFSVCMAMGPFPNIRVEAEGYGSINVQVPAMPGVMRRDFILVPEATISGVVVDEAGIGVAGAIVAARPALGDSQDEASAMETIADDAGHFELAQLAPTKYGLGAFSADGESDHPVVVVSAGHATHDIRLVIAQRARLRGHVMLAGKPVAGARVGTEKSSSMRYSPHYAESQDDGSFVLDGVQLGRIELSADPYEVVSPKVFDVKALAATDMIVEVKETASISGKITRHGVAVANATVTVSPINEVVRSNADGNYEIVGLAPGMYKLTGNGDNRAFTNYPATVTTAQHQTIDLELESGGEVLGTVVDESGTPVPSVMVALGSTNNDDQCTAFTDEHGAFDCTALAGHLDYQPKVFPTAAMQRSFRNASGAPLPLVHVEDGNTVVRDVKLAIKHTMLAIRGRVVDDTGATISDARVSVPGLEWGDAARTRADDNGGFIVDDLVAGSHYDLRARTSDGSTGEASNVVAGTTGLEIKLVRPGTIAGTLVGFTGTIRVLASKALYGQEDTYEGTVDGDHFSITGLQPGSYTVEAARGGTQLDGTSVDVKSGSTATITLHEKARTTIDGHITDLASGAPLAGMACRATLSLNGREGPITGPTSNRLTDSTGAFSVDAPMGRVRVTCVFSGGAHSNGGGEFDIGSGANHVEVTSAANIVPDGIVGFVFEPNLIPPTVFGVAPRTAALGIQVGDQIVAVDGLDTSNMLSDEVGMLIGSKGPGPTVSLKLARGVTIKVPLVPDN